MDWVFGGCFVLAGLAVVGVFTFLARVWLGQRRAVRHGDHTTGWLVEADPDGLAEAAPFVAGQCLISPDREAARDADRMLRLADRVFELKHGDPPRTAAEAEVARLADNDYQAARRDRLPDDFTGGREVYLAHLYLFRTDFPGKRIAGRRLRVAVIWDEPGAMICTRPPGKKRRRDD